MKVVHWAKQVRASGVLARWDHSSRSCAQRWSTEPRDSVSFLKTLAFLRFQIFQRMAESTQSSEFFDNGGEARADSTPKAVQLGSPSLLVGQYKSKVPEQVGSEGKDGARPRCPNRRGRGHRCRCHGGAAGCLYRACADELPRGRCNIFLHVNGWVFFWINNEFY